MKHVFSHHKALQEKRDRMTIFLFLICGAFALWFTWTASVGKDHSSKAVFSLVVLVILVLLAYFLRLRFSLISEIEIHSGTLVIRRFKVKEQCVALDEIVALLEYEHKAGMAYLAIQQKDGDLILLDSSEELKDKLVAAIGLEVHKVE